MPRNLWTSLESIDFPGIVIIIITIIIVMPVPTRANITHACRCVVGYNRYSRQSSSSSVVDGVFIQAIFSMDNALMLVYQTVGGTFPSLSQTGEGFLLQFEKPRLSAEEEWLRACVHMRHQGKTRRACVDRSRRARPTS